MHYSVVFEPLLRLCKGMRLIMKNGKTAYKVALCGVVAALALVLMMLTTVVSAGTYALPMISGILLTVIVLEFNTKWALAVYFAVSVLSFIISGDKEAVLYFIMFFGFYPIIKSNIERVHSKAVQWIIKFALFNACMAASFYMGVYLLGVPVESFSIFGVNLPIVFLLIGNIFFPLYDKCVTLLIARYIKDLRKKIIK